MSYQKKNALQSDTSSDSELEVHKTIEYLHSTNPFIKLMMIGRIN
jgi:hypothetical protein